MWDIFSNEYTKREVKEKADSELAEQFDSPSAIGKAKINENKECNLVKKWQKNPKQTVVRQQTISTLANRCFMNNSGSDKWTGLDNFHTIPY